MEEIKIETLTDILNAVKKHPDQIDILITDIKNFVENNIELEQYFKSLNTGIKTEFSKYFIWLPDNKNEHHISIKYKETIK